MNAVGARPIVLVAGCLAFFAPGRVAAQALEVPGLTEERAETEREPVEAEREPADADRERAEADPAEAVRAAREARLIDPGPAAEARLGRALLRAGEPVQAYRAFRRGLTAEPTDPRLRGELAAGVGRARDRLAVLRLDVPVGARARVDGAAPDWEPGGRIVLLPPGIYRLDCGRPGCVTRSVHLTPGALVDVSLAERRTPPGPRAFRDEGPWLEGNLVIGAAGLALAASASPWLGGAPVDDDGLRVPPAFHLGLGLGLASGALFHMMAATYFHIDWSLPGPDVYAIGVSILGALIASTIALAASGAITPAAGAGAGGALAGFSSTVAGNLMFTSPRWSPFTGVGLTAAVAGLVELLFGAGSLAARDAAAARCQGADAAACRALPTLDLSSFGALSAGATAVLGGLGLALVGLRTGREGRWLGLASLDVSVGAGTVQVTGRL